jgi:hypothetical protein
VPGKGLTQKEIERELQRDSYSQDAGKPAEQRWVTVVIALNNADFDKWCKDNGKNPRDRNLLLATPATARGLQNARLEITPRGMWRPDIHKLMQALVPMLDHTAQQKLSAMGWGLPVP